VCRAWNTSMVLCTGRCRHWGVLQQAQPREKLPTIKGVSASDNPPQPCGDIAVYALPHAACTFAGPHTRKGPVWGLPICNCCLSSPPRRIQAACQPVPSRHTRVRPMRTLQKHPEQLPTGLSFCTKVNGFDPSKRVAGLQGILRLPLPVKPPGAASLS